MEFNKNTIIGLILMLGLAFGVSWYNAKQAQETALEKANTPQEQSASEPSVASASPISNNTNENTVNSDSIDQAQLIAEKGVFGTQTVGSSQIYTLENKQIKVKLTTKKRTMILILTVTVTQNQKTTTTKKKKKKKTEEEKKMEKTMIIIVFDQVFRTKLKKWIC
jgi:hypothetical protein